MNRNQQIKALEATLASLRGAVPEEIKKEPSRPHKIARGTRDIQPLVLAEAPVETLEAGVERLTRERPMSPAAMAKSLGRLEADVLALVRDRTKFYNVGSEEHPCFTFIVGDEIPTAEAYTVVAKLIRDRPFTFQELLSATGIRPGRVSGAIEDLKLRATVMNLGTPNRGRWFVAPKDATFRKAVSK